MRTAWLTFMLMFIGIATSDNALARRVQAAIAVDFDTGDVLYSRGADLRIYPASLTKMMTLYLAFEALEDGRLSYTTKLPVSRRAAGMPASKLGLKHGSTIKVEDAILALITKSANDVAVTVAEKLGGTEIKFAQLMTDKARAMGMSKTKFMNASGLTNRHQRSSVRDMATLARRLITDFPEKYQLFSTRKFSWNGRTYRNTNKLLGTVNGVDGLKTGYTRASGFNLAASAIRNGRRVVAVVAGGKSSKARNDRMVRVLARGFELQKGQLLAIVAPPEIRPELDALFAQFSEKFPAQKPFTNAQDSGDAEPPAGEGLIEPAGLPVLQAMLPSHKPVASQTLAANADGARLVWRPSSESGSARTDSQGKFSVQVGAFHDPQLAHNAAIKATQKVPSILSVGEIMISPLKGTRKPVYRARLSGFSRDVADQACAILKQQNNDCLVVLTAPS